MRSAESSRSMSRFLACWVTHAWVGWVVAPRMWMRRVACSITAITYALVPSSRSMVKKSLAMIASAWERGNCAQDGPLRRGAGSVPCFLGISQTVDGATVMPRLASSPVIGLYPRLSLSLAIRNTSRVMVGCRRGRPGFLGRDFAAQRCLARSRCQRRTVAGVTGRRSPMCCARDHGRQRRDQGPVGPGELRAGGTAAVRSAIWWRSSKISASFQAPERRDRRSHAGRRTARRKTNRRHTADDHRGAAASITTRPQTDLHGRGIRQPQAPSGVPGAKPLAGARGRAPNSRAAPRAATPKEAPRPWRVCSHADERWFRGFAPQLAGRRNVCAPGAVGARSIGVQGLASCGALMRYNKVYPRARSAECGRARSDGIQPEPGETALMRG